MSEQGSRMIHITVRCASHTAGSDVSVECPSSWSVLQLKQHLEATISSKPAALNQRLIFAGRCLSDDLIIGNVVDERSVVEGTQVFHMICSTPQIPENPELRRRQASPPSYDEARNATEVPPQSTNQLDFESFRNLYQNSSSADAYAEYYRNYVQYYQAYQQQLSMMYSMSSTGYQAMPNPVFVQGAMGQPHFVMNAVNLTPGVAVNNQQVQNILPGAMGGNMNMQQNGVANPVAAEGGGAVRRDALEWIFTAFRLLFFVLAITVYSSLERLLLCACIGLVIYYVRTRRANQHRANQAAGNDNNNNQRRLDGEPEPNEDELRRREQIIQGVAGEENQAADHEAVERVVPEDADQQPPVEAEAVPRATVVQTFLTTCYSFVTSFIASLVPDHPVPIDVN